MNLLPFIIVLALVSSAFAQIKLGIDVLRDRGFDTLQGKRVGVVANPASVDASMTPTVEVLRTAPGVHLVALFGPEHGVWGDEYAGDKIDDRTDPRTGLPVFSLYGATRKPTPAMLDQIDVLVFDLQDIGSRSYTYISTMAVCIEAAAEQNKPLIILDRPNPLGGTRIEGGPVEPAFKSFISWIDVPYVHGMTMGELALLVRDRIAPNWTGLTVIPMQGWTRGMDWADTGLNWIPTSPHIPHVSSIAAYAATGIAGELGQISNGVGYTQPFEIVGSPTTDGYALAEAMRKHFDAPGIEFRPIRFKPFYATHRGEVCGGVQVHIDPKTPANLTEISYRLLEAMDAPALLAQSEPRHNMFDKATGSNSARTILAERGDLSPLFAQWQAHSEQFRNERAKYLIYE
jgi:uncharacterized protein YbbC (DUF1343 family)